MTAQTLAGLRASMGIAQVISGALVGWMLEKRTQAAAAAAVAAHRCTQRSLRCKLLLR